MKHWFRAFGIVGLALVVPHAQAQSGKREILLQYKDGAKKVVVPADAPIVRAVPGTRADLVVGEYVFVTAQAAPDGTLRAPRIQVSTDGIKPPQ